MGSTVDTWIGSEEELPRETTRYGAPSPAMYAPFGHSDPASAAATFTATPPPVPPTRWQLARAQLTHRWAAVRSSDMRIRHLDLCFALAAAAATGAIAVIAALELMG